MKYIGEITINGFPGIEKQKKPFYNEPRMPQHIQATPDFVSAKNILDTKGAEGVVEWIGQQKNVLLTDTTFRDAHQSLLATRVRTHDFKKIAAMTEAGLPQLFSSEMWGGATFDVAYRFLTEDPWERLRMFRKKCRIPCCKCCLEAPTLSDIPIIQTMFWKNSSKNLRHKESMYSESLIV